MLLLEYVKDKAVNDNDDTIFCELIEHFRILHPTGNMDDFYRWVETLTPNELFIQFNIAYNL